MGSSLGPTAARKHWGGRDSLSARVAAALGTSKRAAEGALWGPLNLANRCARVIEALQKAGAHEALVRFLQPIDAAIHSAQPPAISRDLFVAEQQTDGSEDTAETAYLTAPSADTARAYLRSIDADQAARTKLRAALAARYGL